ncbi:hypothetical protein BU24DRAFT_202402 [Aaosphaeria arxii CBS 175.79]|uniref:Uncharacterized protein n=1 Tax=Aaosphaeria arxii CBS 175.79 TaxID=1450172 RepID=A0A6A5XUI0_9PLEO|nr:uncharacterized protein BU24DRAFT_202402 [Aaosphaeria arxii CBS 175.79]KAF2016467.1 hypothetical protein BU24DRAFT_202402 [Aaosphaeria arxii CBS 175.79]
MCSTLRRNSRNACTYIHTIDSSHRYLIDISSSSSSSLSPSYCNKKILCYKHDMNHIPVLPLDADVEMSPPSIITRLSRPIFRIVYWILIWMALVITLAIIAVLCLIVYEHLVWGHFFKLWVYGVYLQVGVEFIRVKLDDTNEWDELDDTNEWDELDETNELDELDETNELDELDEMDETNELDELDDDEV